MTDRLSLYNGALVEHLGETPLETLTDDVPVRYALDGVWDRDGVVRCLKAGQWNFAARSARMEYDPDITPDFGYRFAFPKPDDFVRTLGVCSDGYHREPLTLYRDEGRMWWADLETIYVRFVSKDAQYGRDFSLWPEDFTEYVEASFAYRITKLATYSSQHERMEGVVKAALLKAQNGDAMEQPSTPMVHGSWARSRGRYRSGENG